MTRSYSILIFLLTLLFPAAAFAQIASNPFIHYDASVTGSITLEPDTNKPFPNDFIPAPYTDYVSVWADQSGNGFDATTEGTTGGANAFNGLPLYQGDFGHTFSNGVDGIEFGGTTIPEMPPDPRMVGNGTAVNLLNSGAEQESLLDFTGAASANSGITVYMVYHADESGGSFGPNFDYLLGNFPFPNNDGGIGMWLNDDGFVWGTVDGEADIFGGNVDDGGETILSFTYDAVSGNYTVGNVNNPANNPNGSDASNTSETPVAANDFTSSLFLGLGGSPRWANFRTDGDFGEVLIYDRYIDPASSDHTDTIAALQSKWFSSVSNPADSDGDGDVDGADFLKIQRESPGDIPTWIANYPAPLQGSISAVPEPSAIALIVLGSAALASIRRRHW